MSYNLQTYAGPGLGGAGTQTQLRASIPHGDLVVAEGKGRYYESVRRGSVFSLYLNATSSTIAAGNIEAATAAASTQFAIWNPVSSGINISLLKFGIGVISGTPPGGAVTHSITTTVPTVASASAQQPPICNNLSAAVCGAGYMASAAGTTLTGGGALKTLRVAQFATTGTAQASVAMTNSIEDIGGDILLPPGTMWVPTHRTAGTTALHNYSITWEEIRIP